MAGEGDAFSGESGIYPTIGRYGGLPDSGSGIQGAGVCRFRWVYQLQIAITQVERIYHLCRFGQWRTGPFPVLLPIERQQGTALYFEAG